MAHGSAVWGKLAQGLHLLGCRFPRILLANIYRQCQAVERSWSLWIIQLHTYLKYFEKFCFLRRIDITEDKQPIWGLALKQQSVFWNLWSMSVTGGLNHWDTQSQTCYFKSDMQSAKSNFCLFTTGGKLLPKAAKLIFACFVFPTACSVLRW